MLTKQTPEKIATTLTVKAQGVENTLKLTYVNHTPAAFKTYTENTENFKVPDDVPPENLRLRGAHVNATFALFVVSSFDDGTDTAFPLNRAGLIDLEDHWPGTLNGIVIGYHQARAAAVEKN